MAADGADSLSRTMSAAGDAADAEFGDATLANARAACPLLESFTVRLEHQSRYTASKRYTKTEWVPAKDFIFLIGQERKLSVRVAEPEGASAEWEVTPLGVYSGTIPTRTGSGNQFDYIPKITVAQRPISGTRIPNKPVRYQIKATVTYKGKTQQKIEVIEQDERDIIRQEWVDSRSFRKGFELHVPYRESIVRPKFPEYRTGNYQLVVDSAMSTLIAATEKIFGSPIRPNSGWRNPRRNIEVDGKTNSNHQHGGAVDMRPEGVAKGGLPWRKAMRKLYNAAMQVPHDGVILERKSEQLYKKNLPLPEPSESHPDKDGDGLPDDATWAGRKLSVLFGISSHVHIDRNPPGGGDDD